MNSVPLIRTRKRLSARPHRPWWPAGGWPAVRRAAHALLADARSVGTAPRTVWPIVRGRIATLGGLPRLPIRPPSPRQLHARAPQTRVERSASRRAFEKIYLKYLLKRFNINLSNFNFQIVL